MHADVESSNLACCGWDGGRMTATFRNGKEYHYHGVPRAAYDAVVSAESKGKAFRERVVGQYPHCDGRCPDKPGGGVPLPI